MNGIIINGILHELVETDKPCVCDGCSLSDLCDESLQINCICDVLLNPEGTTYINSGKVKQLIMEEKQ